MIDIIWITEIPDAMRQKHGKAFLKVGRIIKRKDGEILLVGNINCLGGWCDCCSDWYDDVVAYSDSLLETLSSVDVQPNHE